MFFPRFFHSFPSFRAYSLTPCRPWVPRLVHELHKRGISTFLVTNGQFPEELQQLSWVTQLYVSLDAPNEHDLKAPDVERKGL